MARFQPRSDTNYCGLVEEAPRNWGGSFLRNIVGVIQWLKTILVLEDGMLMIYDADRPEDCLESYDVKDFKMETFIKDENYEKNYVIKLSKANLTLEYAVPAEEEFKQWRKVLEKATK